MTAVIILGSLIGLVTSILGYFLVGLSLLAAFGIYVGTPLALVAIVCLVRTVRPQRETERKLAFAD